MSNKLKTANKSGPNTIIAAGRPDEDEAVAIARTVMSPSVQAAVTLKDYGNGFGDLDLSGLIDSLSEQITLSSDGDLMRAEAMLTAQAHTLDAIFNNLAQRAIKAKYMDNLDCYLKLALRAQSQSRMTWEALATIKNPPMMGYVGQANIAHGPQQVNNQCTGNDSNPRAGKKQNLQNKLLENINGERLDIGKAGTSSTADPAMAAVGEINGTENRGR